MNIIFMFSPYEGFPLLTFLFTGLQRNFVCREHWILHFCCSCIPFCVWLCCVYILAWTCEFSWRHYDASRKSLTGFEIWYVLFGMIEGDWSCHIWKLLVDFTSTVHVHLNLNVTRAVAWRWRLQRSCWHDEHVNSYKRYGGASSRKFRIIMLVSGIV